MSERDRAAARPAWDGVIEMPVRERLRKPRERGWTMVIDKGLGLNAIDDLMQVSAPVIDVLKLSFGTSAFFGRDLLKEKVRTVTAHGVHCMPGGTFQEVAVWQGALDRYLDRARELGFDAVEVSDGTIEMDRRTRADAIARAVKAGFRVLSEVGKKDPADAQPMAVLADLVNADLDDGAFMVIMEAREAGKGVGIYDASGLPREAEIEAFLKGVRDPGRILWEAPLGLQQRYLVLRFGADVNLGNVAPDDVLALEALRCGLRGDTLKRAWLAAGARGADATSHPHR
jgi:phosphosulfolactate synthase